MMTRIYLFPGQGAQSVGMGAQLFEKYREIIRQADNILGYSIRALCLEDPDGRLIQTAYTQPALYVVNALSYMEKRDKGIIPDYAAGHSLGEYNALLAAGAFDFATGLRLVQKRGELMGRAHGGGMVAIIDLEAEQIIRVLEDEALLGIDIANLNTPQQIVISGPIEELERAYKPLLAAGATHFIPLRVSAAFHSRYMKPAEDEFRSFLQQFRFSPLQFPVLSNVEAMAYETDALAETLAMQISRPVRWLEIIRRFMSLDNPEFEEVGPGKSLTKLTGRIMRQATPLPGPFTRSRPATAANNKSQPRIHITAEALGSADFRCDFGLRYAYVSGAMYRGVASEDLVLAMARAGLLGFFGAGGLSLERIDAAIQTIQRQLRAGESFGMNLLHDLNHPEAENAVVDLYLARGVSLIEASAFMQITPALVRYRARGLTRTANGSIAIANRVVGKVSRPEVAEAFLSPAPGRIVQQLLDARKITAEQAELVRAVPMADAVTVEADSGGHTDQGVAIALLPAMLTLRDRLARQHGHGRKIYIGAAGGIGTPHAVAAMFVLGADYIVTGSINQCTVESGASDAVKELLQSAEVQDVTMAPAGDMFELGARVQVFRKGVFFPARANKLYELYKQYESIEQIDPKIRAQIETRYFRRTFDQVYDETREYFRDIAPQEIAKADANPKHKMALIFRWYFGHSNRLAAEGRKAQQVDFQIHCGPALGAFNSLVQGTELEPWGQRRVARIAEKLMTEGARLLTERYEILGRMQSR